MSIKKIILLVILILLTSLIYYLFRPLSVIPQPAEFTCLDIKDGQFIPFDSLPNPQNIYGMGLTYSQHLIETASEFDPDIPPPIFRKKGHSITGNNTKVKLPSKNEMIAAVEEF